MKNLSLLLLLFVLTSCSTSSNVVHNGFFQKRKYKNGYNLSFKKKDCKVKKRKEESNVLVTNAISLKKEKTSIKKTNRVQVLEIKKEKQFKASYASINNSQIIEYQSVLSKFVGDTIVDDYVNTQKEGIDSGAQKIRIKRSKLYILLSFVGLGVFFVGVAISPLLGSLGKFIFIPFFIALYGYYASMFNLVEYTRTRVASMMEPSQRDVKLLKRSKRLRNISILSVVFLGVSIILFLAMVLIRTLSPDMLIFLTLLWIIDYIHFIVFLIMSIVNYLILYFSQRKEMKYEITNFKKYE